MRESKINVFEPVFNLVIINHVDEFECLAGLQIFWELPWGGLVTLRLLSTLRQYNFITSMLQEVTDLLQQSGLL